jgi:hypothetical protein
MGGRRAKGATPGTDTAAKADHMTMESSERARHLISDILANLRELSYETERQDRIIGELREQLAARGAAPSPSADGSTLSLREAERSER